MTKKYFIFTGLLAVACCSWALPVLRLEEEMSLWFDRIGGNAQGDLELTTSTLSEMPMMWTADGSATRHETGKGIRICVPKGTLFRFGHARAPVHVLASVSPAAIPLGMPRPPREFMGDEFLLFLKIGTRTAFVSPRNGKAIVAEHEEDFPFPFTRIWEDEDEFRRWSAGTPFRMRYGVVVAEAQKRKLEADGVLKGLVELLGGDLALGKTVPSKAWNRFVVPVGSPLMDITTGIEWRCMEVHRHGRVIDIRFDGSAGQSVCRFRLDGPCKLWWYFLMVKPSSDTGDLKSVGRKIYEFGDDGGLRRALVDGPHPLLVVRRRHYYFTGDGKLLDAFIGDFSDNMGVR